MKISSLFVIGNSEEGFNKFLPLLLSYQGRVANDLDFGRHCSESGMSWFGLNYFRPFPIGRSYRLEIQRKERVS